MATLKEGSKDRARVLAWQQLLVDEGHELTVDGLFGPETTEVTQDFQREYRLEADGVVGKETYAVAGGLPSSERATRDVYAALGAVVRVCPSEQLAAVPTRLRLAHFLGQCAHETGQWRWFEEIWGPTAAQKRYEPPSKLASGLGNTETGDGRRFKGRGPIQLTGRANYNAFNATCPEDVIAHPELVAHPPLGFRASLWFFDRNEIWPWCDRDDVLAVSRAINLGNPKSKKTPNGMAERRRLLAVAKQSLGIG